MTTDSNHHEQEPPAQPDADLTAYALGELDPGNPEHAVVEARLAESSPAGDAAHAELAALRDTAADLAAALAAEPAPASTATMPQMSSTASATSDAEHDAPRVPPMPRHAWPRRLAIAASLAAAAALGVALLGPDPGSTPSSPNAGANSPADLPDDRSTVTAQPVQVDPHLIVQARQDQARQFADDARTAADQGYTGLAWNLISQAHELDPDNAEIEAQRTAFLAAHPDQINPEGLAHAVDNFQIQRQAAASSYDEAMAKAEAKLAAGDYAGASNDISIAKATIERNAAHFGVSEFEQRRNAAAELSIRVSDQQIASVISADSLAMHRAEHDNAPSSESAAKQNREEARALIQQARQLQKEMKYDDALLLLDRATFIEPDNFTAQLLTEVIEDSKVAVDSRRLGRERLWFSHASHSPHNREERFRYTDLVTYPEDWPELSSQRVRGLETTPDAIGFSETLSITGPRTAADRETALRLQKTVPINFDSNRLETVIRYLRETTGAEISVDWQALQYASGIERDAPITLTLNDVPAGRALELVLQQAASQGFGEPMSATVVNGVVVIAPGPADPQLHEPESAFNTETYDRVIDNAFLAAFDRPLSTFSIDVDTASYANVRRFLQQGQLPPGDAVRIEELVNYFDYAYEPPAVIHLNHDVDGELPGAPFAAHVEVTAAPWSPENRLVRIGIKGMEVATDDRPAANLVFLLDVSGSMNNPQKLPLVKAGMTKLVEHLRMDDRVAIVVYAGASGLVLDSTSDHDAVLAAIDDLTPGGSTNGAAGIELAYDIAIQNHIPGGLNRVILCTDGDFNVGITDRGALTRLIEDKANAPETPTYLTVLGFGTGNLKDATMEELSNVGDGNYGYVDSQAEAEKLLAEQVNATLLTIAKDVKVQVEFNPRKVAAYRLIGYENRLLAKEDFNNDVVDAGDIGAGHTVTALYEVALASNPPRLPQQPTTQQVDDLKYQQPAALSDAADSDELLTLKLRYKQPDAAKVQGTSKLLVFPVEDADRPFAEASEDTRFAAAVAGFGMLLRGSPYAGELDFAQVAAMAEASAEEWINRLGDLPPEQQRRQEFMQLVRRAAALASPDQPAVVED